LADLSTHSVVLPKRKTGSRVGAVHKHTSTQHCGCCRVLTGMVRPAAMQESTAYSVTGMQLLSHGCNLYHRDATAYVAGVRPSAGHRFRSDFALPRLEAAGKHARPKRQTHNAQTNPYCAYVRVTSGWRGAARRGDRSTLRASPKRFSCEGHTSEAVRGLNRTSEPLRHCE
jgi:hypothetical protein